LLLGRNPLIQLGPKTASFAAKALISKETFQLPKLYVEGSIPFARSISSQKNSVSRRHQAAVEGDRTLILSAG